MPKPLNVLQIIDSLEVGGAEMMAVNIANGLHQHGVTSHICITRKEGLLKEKLHKEIGYLFLERQRKVDFKAVLNLKKYIKKHQISFIHAHSSSFFIAVLVKLFQPSLKIVWHDHYGKSEEINKRKSMVLRFCSIFFSQVIAVNQILVQWAKQQLLVKKVEFLANFAILKNTAHHTFLKGISEKRIICVAAFRPQKDHLNLLQAFNEIKNKFPGWTLHFVGQPQNDIYTHQIKNIIENEGLKESVFLYGACLDIKHVLQQASIGVLSSSSEGLPVALLEYGLAGLPVIVTDVGDCKKVVNDFGWVVPKQHAQKLADALQEVIKNTEVRSRKAHQFQRHIIENYSEKAYFTNLMKIYKSC